MCAALATVSKCTLIKTRHTVLHLMVCVVPSACQTGALMEDIELEQLPEGRDSRWPQAEADQLDDNESESCKKFQRSLSRWMLPEDARKLYLARAKYCPPAPPIFMIFISVAEVALP